MSRLKVLAPFGPKIAKLKLPKSVIKKINLEVDRITKIKRLIKKYDYSKSLVGQVKQEIQLPSIFIKRNIYKHISNSIKEYVKTSTGKTNKKVKIINFWIVRQYAHEYNPHHPMSCGTKKSLYRCVQQHHRHSEIHFHCTLIHSDIYPLSGCSSC